MGDIQTFVYYCKACGEETISFGVKRSCPYCKAKSPKFALRSGNETAVNNNRRHTTAKQNEK